MKEDKKGIAIFDFDGTIIKKDSFIEFIRFTHGSVKLYYCYIYYSLYVILYFLKLYPNNKLKELFFGFFYKGLGEEKLNKLGVEFSTQKIDSFCYEDARRVLQWHKDKSHDILILTASSDIWIGEWCRRNGFNLIDTKFEVRNGVYTGKIDGINCYGKEKVKRIENLIKDYDFSQTYGYGDSKADLHFLKKTYYIHYGALKNKAEYRINNNQRD
jgi:phosphatidylglycerophosphatase C